MQRPGERMRSNALLVALYSTALLGSLHIVSLLRASRLVVSD
jgi:hypothetical protein